ncbi:hypothetical protein LUZ60_015764 [Juncus effusus]|nr:hypothetical protein LUZ60_015764 [Juncus effusus]
MKLMSTLSFLPLLLLILPSLISCDDSSLQNKCANEIAKLTNCLDYSTGKTNVPSSQCCSSTTEIRKDDPVCLCYIIQQTHAGSENVKSLGIRFDRLISLPTDCKMANASVSNCPKLLNLSPSSPDYSIFTTNTTKASSTAAVPTNDSLNLVMPSISIFFTVLMSLISFTFF